MVVTEPELEPMTSESESEPEPEPMVVDSRPLPAPPPPPPAAAPSPTPHVKVNGRDAVVYIVQAHSLFSDLSSKSKFHEKLYFLRLSVFDAVLVDSY